MSSSLMLLLFAGAIGLAVYLFVVGIYPAGLIEAASQQVQRKGVKNTSVSKEAKNIIVRRLGSFQSPFISDAYREKMKWKFIAMGEPDMQVEDFLVGQEFAAILFTLMFLMVLNFLHKDLYLASAGTVLGFLYPYMWLSEQIKKRQKKIVRAMPYALDLLTLSVEAGLDFQAAIGTVVEKSKGGPLSDEFALLLSEIRMGRTREEALRNLAKRIQVSQITAFVTNLIQADRMGTSLGKILRIQSTQMRINRTQLAEKKANEAPVKMLFPLVLCIFPTVFMVLFGPIIYSFISGGGGM